MPFRLPPPPSGVTGELRRYLEQIQTALNQTPVFSYFSGTSPNSLLTGERGDFSINVGSASTLSRLWFKSGPDATNTASTVSWRVVTTV